MKKISVFSIIVVLLTLISKVAVAQIFLEEHKTGRPIILKQYVDVDGSPYLLENWTQGSVKSGKGEMFEGVPLNYDLVTDMLLFKGKDGQPLEFIDKIVEFSLPVIPGKTESEVIFRSGYPAVDGAGEKTFYEVLAEGKITLLKRSQKVIREEKVYNSATIKKKILLQENYYLAGATELERIKLNEKSIYAVLNDKRVELKEFVAKNKIKIKEEEDLIKLINYYNSI